MIILFVMFDEIIYYVEMVGWVVSCVLVIVDLLFFFNYFGVIKVVEYVGRILKEM